MNVERVFIEKNSVNKYHRECIKRTILIQEIQKFSREGTQPPSQTLPLSALDLRCPFQVDWTPALVKS